MSELPSRPIDRITAPFERFLHVEASGGIVLLGATLVALVIANSPLAEGFAAFWKTPVSFGFGEFVVRHSIKHWVNDGLMAIFFFVMGLEVKRELVIGELTDLRKAALPIAAALGGMVVPAALYLLLLQGHPAQGGWGIPMATDIAFVVGCMAVLGSRVPHGFRVLLLSLAIADDIGAILVIAFGYTETIHVGPLLLGAAGVGFVLLLQRLGARSFLLYVVLGTVVWFGFHESGIHATIAGVILGLLTPARASLSTSAVGRRLDEAARAVRGEWPDKSSNPAADVRQLQSEAREVVSPLEYLEDALHPWVSFLILPLFALANAGVPVRIEALADAVSLAVGAGLVVGKPLGILLFSWLAVRSGLASLPDGVGWPAVVGGGALAGIGFTMSLFIAGLALGPETLDNAKVGILGASVVSATLGMLVLSRTLPSRA